MIAGVVEGFYGRPWNARQRHQLFGWMKEGGLNTYLYAPKDDRKHRSRWREEYDTGQEAELGALLRDCQRHQIDFVYAIAPGLDIRFTSDSDRTALESKLVQIARLGVRRFALLFDDIPAVLHPEDQARFPSHAHAQSETANRLREALQRICSDSSLWFCPTEYCGRMAGNRPADSPYLRVLGERLHPEIAIFWTGREIIAETLGGPEIEELAQVLRRKPLIWDNLWANDYDVRRVHLGPFTGRDASLAHRCSGIVINPNCEFEANFMPIMTFARWCANPSSYQPDEAFTEAATAWTRLFNAGTRHEISAEDVSWLAEHFYLPYQPGPAGRELWQSIEQALHAPSPVNPATRSKLERTLQRLTEIQQKLGELENRDLLLALYRPVWDLKECLLFLTQYLAWRDADGQSTFTSADHAPELLRGGLIAALQSCLNRGPDGSVAVNPARFFPGTAGTA